jgi:hypothetical protein
MKHMHLLVLLVAGGSMAFAAERVLLPNAVVHMPVKEVTVFKDGHAFVLHEGRLPTDAAGQIVLDNLPVPVIGTFWPYSGEKEAPLASVTASRRKMAVERTPMTVREMIEASGGAEIALIESGQRYVGRVVGIPTRTAEELRRTSPPDSEEALDQKSNQFFFQTFDALKLLDFTRVSDVTFKTPPKAVVGEEFRNVLTLKLDWGNRQPEAAARAGLVYLQKGIRWIPNYRISLDGNGGAVAKLQATLVNELTDLEDVTVHLVIGVPTFAFKDTADPIALPRVTAALSRFFQEDARTAYAFNNAIMTQQAVDFRNDARPVQPYSQPRVEPGAEPRRDLGPEVAVSGQSEDLFLFTIKHITLRKGDRMVVPVVEHALKYKDVYVLNLPYTPPSEVRRSFNPQQQTELARLIGLPKVMHHVRLINPGTLPITTAPALILRGEQVIAQGMTTYTATGASSDVPLTAAVDISVRKTESEVEREKNAASWLTPSMPPHPREVAYSRAKQNGKITIVSYHGQPVDLEVTRHLVGNADTADHEGVVTGVNMSEDDFFWMTSTYPAWWSWYAWADWWYHFNGMGRVDWKLTLKPGEKAELGYTWHYFWP